MHLEDPVVRGARREALAAFALWLLAMSYTVGYCYLYGYRREPADIRLIGGIPEWVLWGVVAPWSVCTLAAGVFAWFISDADLGQQFDEPDDDPFAEREPSDE